ncbi:MAG: hypothetical protein ACI4OU_01490 [Candidatus Enterenecus sp.]
MEINTHGININLDKLQDASNGTVNWDGRGGHTDIFYDRQTGDVWCVDNIGDNWTEYRDPAIIEVAKTARHYSAQWIADRIYDKICERRMIAAELGEVYTDTW